MTTSWSQLSTKVLNGILCFAFIGIKIKDWCDLFVSLNVNLSDSLRLEYSRLGARMTWILWSIQVCLQLCTSQILIFTHKVHEAITLTQEAFHCSRDFSESNNWLKYRKLITWYPVQNLKIKYIHIKSRFEYTVLTYCQGLMSQHKLLFLLWTSVEVREWDVVHPQKWVSGFIQILKLTLIYYPNIFYSPR